MVGRCDLCDDHNRIIILAPIHHYQWRRVSYSPSPRISTFEYTERPKLHLNIILAPRLSQVQESHPHTANQESTSSHHCNGRPYGGNRSFIHPNPFPPSACGRGLAAVTVFTDPCARLGVCPLARVAARGGVGLTTGFNVRCLAALFPAPVPCTGTGLTARISGRRKGLLTSPCFARESGNVPFDATGSGRGVMP